MLSLLFICFAFLTFRAEGTPSRTVSRSGPSGSVNLVEFSANGRNYGKCNFEDDGEQIEIIYEEGEDGELQARSHNPTIIDPELQARRCFEFASRPVRGPGQFRLGLGGEPTAESPEEIEARLNDMQYKIQTNQQYISDLRPRFVGLALGAMAFNRFNKDYLVTFGGDDKDQKATSISVPQTHFNKVGIVLPWKMFQQHGGW